MRKSNLPAAVAASQVYRTAAEMMAAGRSATVLTRVRLHGHENLEAAPIQAYLDAVTTLKRDYALAAIPARWRLDFRFLGCDDEDFAYEIEISLLVERRASRAA